jgi:hypothetical protein
MTAFLAKGWDVCQPVATRPYDLTVEPPEGGRILKAQVKTIRERADRPAYLIIQARNHAKQAYPTSDVDLIVGVDGRDVYVIENDGKQSEFWTKKSEPKWTKLNENDDVEAIV